MKKLTSLQLETMSYLIKQIDEARSQTVDITKAKKRERLHIQRILDAQNGIVLSPGGSCTIRTLKALEQYGLIEIIQDNSGIGTGGGAFPSVVRVLNY